MLIEVTIDQLHVADLTEVHEGDDGFALEVYLPPERGPRLCWSLSESRR
jgi:hypothetical protein